MHFGIVIGTKLKGINGDISIDDLKIGDEILHDDGEFRKVTMIGNPYETDIWKFIFKDDEIFTGNSNFNVFNSYWSPNSRIRVVNTSDIEKMLTAKHIGLYFKLPTPVKTETLKELMVIHPYVMGVLLGDGSFRYKNPFLACADEEVIRETNNLLPNSLWLKPVTVKDRKDIFFRVASLLPGSINVVNREIVKLGLRGKYSHDKIIPNCYMENNHNGKIQLIQGLMDTDGTSEIKGAVSFTSTSLVMVKQLETLIRSIGGMGTVSSKFTNYTYKDKKKTGRESYTLTIRISDRSQLFKLPRKKIRVLGKSQYSDKLKRRILSVSSSGKDYCYDVETNGDSLLVYNNYIVLGN